MRECVELFLLYIAIAGGTIVLFGYELTWREKLGIFWDSQYSWDYSLRVRIL